MNLEENRATFGFALDVVPRIPLAPGSRGGPLHSMSGRPWVPCGVDACRRVPRFHTAAAAAAALHEPVAQSGWPFMTRVDR